MCNLPFPQPQPRCYLQDGRTIEGGTDPALGTRRSRCGRSCRCQCPRVPTRHVSLRSLYSPALFPLTRLRHSVKTRLQVQVKRKPGETVKASGAADEIEHYDGALHAIRSIVRDDGITGLYAGLVGSLIGVASTNFAYFYWYSVVRSVYAARAAPGSKPGTIVELSLGAVAGALAQLFTIPIAVVTTRQQTQPRGEKKGMFETAKEVINSEDGWTGLWRGMKASLVLVVNPSITYGAYQRLKDVLYPGRDNLRPHEAFRKSIPTPFQLSKLIVIQFSVLCRKHSLQSQRSPLS